MAYVLRKRYMDCALICVLAAAALVTALIVYLTHTSGSMVIVKVDGVTVRELTLDDEASFSVEGYQGGINRIVIHDGKAYVTEADCPDGLCVKTGEISRTGETIVCLPHRVVVEIKGESSSDDLDSVVR